MERFCYDYVFVDPKDPDEPDPPLYQIFIIYIKDQRKFWFKGVDVSAALQHKHPNQRILNIVPERDRRGWGDITLFKEKHKIWRQDATFLTERGVKALIDSSRTIHARPFKKWLYDYVLPDIHKTLDAFRYTATPSIPGPLDMDIWQIHIGNLKRLGILKNYLKFTKLPQ